MGIALTTLARLASKTPNYIRGLRARRLPGWTERQGSEIGGLAKFRLFHDVEVVPPTKLYLDAGMVDGGPIWPDFANRTAIRYCLNGKAVDTCPPSYPGHHSVMSRPCVWGGFARPHFGHLVAEHLTRVLVSIRRRPTDTFLFVAEPGFRGLVQPGYFWELLDWYGLPRAQAHFVTRPLIVSELRVVPQAEQIGQRKPDPAYLDLLDENAARNQLTPIPSRILYVTRSGMLLRRCGGHAGEAYLVEVLRQLGVAILDPARATLRRQMAEYAGAQTLIFAEGSSLHGRQLLGRIDQAIVVMNRRVGSRIAQSALTPRSADLAYVEATHGMAAWIRHDGLLMAHQALAFYDLPALFAGFRAVGVDLARVWNNDAYISARDVDVSRWLWVMRLRFLLRRSKIRLDETRARLGDVFAAEGISAQLPHRMGRV